MCNVAGGIAHLQPLGLIVTSAKGKLDIRQILDNSRPAPPPLTTDIQKKIRKFMLKRMFKCFLEQKIYRWSLFVVDVDDGGGAVVCCG